MPVQVLEHTCTVKSVKEKKKIEKRRMRRNYSERKRKRGMNNKEPRDGRGGCKKKDKDRKEG